MSRLEAVECPDSTYRPSSHPLVFSKAKGSIISDSEGREYIDLCAGFGVLALGHNHPSLRIELENEVGMTHGMGDVYPSTDKIEFLEKLTGLYPWGKAKALLALSGSQAVEAALKTALLATGNAGFICFANSYHGLDLGVLPVTHREDFSRPFRSWLQPGLIEFVPFGCDRATLEGAKDALVQRRIGVAGLLVEPIQGRAGVRIPPAGWLKQCADFAKSNQIVSVLDDIFAGIGRTGLMTNAETAEFDLVCFGKAIGGGLPISACVGKASVMDSWPTCTSESIHTGTFFGHPMSCRIGSATLKEIQSQSLSIRSGELGISLLERLKTDLSDLRSVRSVHGKGLMVAIEFHQAGAGAVLMDSLREVGIIALASGEKGQCLALTPALNIPEATLWTAVDRIIAMLRK